MTTIMFDDLKIQSSEGALATRRSLFRLRGSPSRMTGMYRYLQLPPTHPSSRAATYRLAVTSTRFGGPFLPNEANLHGKALSHRMSTFEPAVMRR